MGCSRFLSFVLLLCDSVGLTPVLFITVISEFLANDTVDVLWMSAEIKGAISTSLSLGPGIVMGLCHVFSYFPSGIRDLYGIGDGVCLYGLCISLESVLQIIPCDEMTFTNRTQLKG